jgi:hypothetical protein
MSSLDFSKNVHMIVHGQTDLVGVVRQKLIALGFSDKNLHQASLDSAGGSGEYVAMVWPPMAAKQIIISEIVGRRKDSEPGSGMGDWARVGQKEISRLQL